MFDGMIKWVYGCLDILDIILLLEWSRILKSGE